MAFALGTIPRWYFVDNTGRPLANGFVYTYRQDNRTPLSVYQDEAGTLPYPNPFRVDGNGTFGPIYWDDSIPYFIEVQDSNAALMYTIPNYQPAGSGGGGSTTTVTELKNLVTNNIFLHNINGGSGSPFGTAPTPVVTTNETNLVICPSSHTGLTNGDIRFVKDSTANTDSITFTKFGAGSVPFSSGGASDATPVYYLTYNCSTSNAGESTKYIQFPLTHGVKNLEQKVVSVTFWAKASSATTVTAAIAQFFGDGTNSPGVGGNQTVETTDSESITTSWAKYTANITIPSIGAGTIGNCGNDGLFMRLKMPTNTVITVDLALPSTYVGTNVPPVTWQSEPEVVAQLDTPRTGDVRISMNNHFPWGWVPANDGFIGSSGTSATAGINRANDDTFPLYNLLWNTVSDTYAPVTGGRGASAIADFAGNKAMRLTRMLGRVLAGGNAPLAARATAFTVSSSDAGADTITLSASDTSDLPTGTPIYFTGTVPTGVTAGTVYYIINADLTTSTIQLAASLDFAIAGTPVVDIISNTSGATLFSAIGNFVGEGLHTLLTAEMPTHTHGVTFNRGQNYSAPLSSNVLTNDQQSGTVSTTSDPTGGGGSHNTMQPTAFMNVYLKL